MGILAINDSLHLAEIPKPILLEPRNDLLQSQLSFVRTDDVDAILEILLAPLRRIGPADEHELGAIGLCDLGEFEDVCTRDDVGIETDDSRPKAPNALLEISEIPERRIENLH